LKGFFVAVTHQFPASDQLFSADQMQESVSSGRFFALRIQLRPDCAFEHSNQIVDGRQERKPPINLFLARVFGLAEPANGLHPAENLLHPTRLRILRLRAYPG